VTENLVGKEAMVNLGCLEELAKMLLGMLKPLSVINPFHHGRNSCLADSK
jgi:hypothetical protein